MIKPFKFLQGRPPRLYHYNTSPPSYINTRYDTMVARHVSNCMRTHRHWRGYETWVHETNGYATLRILAGINIGGMFHINYSITRNNDTEEYRISVPLADLQRG